MKKLLFSSALLALLSGCSFTSQKINDGAYFVDSMDSKNPLVGLYIELMVTEDEGSTYNLLASTHTDENGYFYFDEEFGNCFDCWEHVHIYSDSNYTDTLGLLTYAFQDKLSAPLVLHTDTFTLEHQVWIVPRIGDIGNVSADKINIRFDHIDPIGVSANLSYTQNITSSTTFPAVETTLNIGFQHWFNFGSGELAQGRLYNGGTEIGWGYFTLTDYRATSPGDTLFIDFALND